MKRLVLFSLMMLFAVIRAELEQEEIIEILTKECVHEKNDESCRVFCNSITLDEAFCDDVQLNKVFFECGHDANNCAAFREYVAEMAVRRRMKELADLYSSVKIKVILKNK